MHDTIIIGAGIAGLACARRLTDAGLTPLILDKGRGIGGRLSTRRAGDLRFDHGAQYVSAKTPAFSSLMQQLTDQGAAGLWEDGSNRSHYVGMPGMSGLARGLAQGLNVRQGIEITAMTNNDTSWTLHGSTLQGVTEQFQAERVVITIPAPQIPHLLRSDDPLLTQIAQVRYAPCITLMAAFSADSPQPFISRRDPDDDLAWIACDSSKPGRPEQARSWVAQAGPAFSARWIEEDNQGLANRMLPLLCERIGTRPESALYASAHRWLYARVTEALGQNYLCSNDSRLYLGGDWCLDARVEAAWQSGDAIGRAISLAHAPGVATRPPVPGH